MNALMSESQAVDALDTAHSASLLKEDWLTRHVFSLEAGPQRRQVASGLTFEKNGRIGNYSHPNEAAWRIVEEKLFILREDGTPSCVAVLVTTADGSLEIMGPFLQAEEAYVHYFRPIGLRKPLPAVQSFDLFDTLVARYCVEPFAIFQAVEAKSRVAGFANYRRDVEAFLWQNGNYSLDTIYAGLRQVTNWPEATLLQLKMLELSEEWNNLFAIGEMVSRVRNDDLIVSDMYLPGSFIRKIVDEKCGLHGLPIYLSNHGKHHGTIWRGITGTYNIVRHYGDNYHSDVLQAKKAGIDAEHVTPSAWSLGELVLCSIGLNEFAKAIRKARLTSAAFGKLARHAQMAQFDANIPLLIVAGTLLLRKADEHQADTLLMCGRDCNMWVHLVDWLNTLSPAKKSIHYWPSSRDLFLADSPAYAAYFNRLRGQRTIIADVSGTGRTPTNFVARMSAQADTSVFLAIRSDQIASHMEARAPARDDVVLDSCITMDAERLLFERFNVTAKEDRATGMEFSGTEFNVLREPKPMSPVTIDIVNHMQDAFALTLSILKEAPILALPTAVTDEQLRDAMHKLALVGVNYLELAQHLPE